MAQGTGWRADPTRSRRDDAAAAGRHRRRTPAVGVVRGLAGRGLPAPSPGALIGVAVLVLLALGAVHLAGRGTAVPVDPAPVASASAVPAAATGADEGTGSDQATGSDGASGSAGVPTAAGSTGGPGSATEAAAPSTSTPSEVTVHVSGAVADPGVVTLPAGSRVDDAVAAAGGAREEAALDALNLARPLVDGEQVHVPVPGEEPRPTSEAAAPGTPSPAPSGTSGGAGDSGDALIDLNTASATELEELPGIGPALAARIIEHREAHGAFASVDDLLAVPGIGPATLEEIRPRATV